MTRQSESLKVSSLLSLHFFSSLWFFFFPFFLLEMKKMLRKMFETEGQKREGRSTRAKTGTKSERAKRELEGKLTPISWFFFCCCFLVCFVSFVFENKKMMAMCCYLLLWWCCKKEEDDGNVSSFFMALLQRRRR